MVKSETLDLLDLAFVWQIRISYSYLSIFHHISSSFSCFRFELSPWSRVIFASICCVFKSGVGAKQLWRMIIHNKTRYTPSRSSVQPHNIFHFQVLFPLSSFATHIVALVMNSTKATIQQHPFEHMIVRQIPVASRKCKFCISVYFYYRLLPSFPSSSPTPVTCGQPKNPRDDPSTLFVSSSSCSPREETASMPTTTPLGSEMSLNDQCMLGATVLCQAFFCMQRTQSFVQGVRDSQNVHTSIRFLVFVRTCQVPKQPPPIRQYSSPAHCDPSNPMEYRSLEKVLMLSFDTFPAPKAWRDFFDSQSGGIIICIPKGFIRICHFMPPQSVILTADPWALGLNCDLLS